MANVRPRFEVADVVHAYGDELRRRYRLSATQERVLKNISICRTAALGGHLDKCQNCEFVRVSYNSCRDRHCPKCQGPRRAEWVTKRLERLLPIPYFHVVFTLPAELNPLALRHPAVVYRLLFAAASQTLLELAQDPKRLGAQVGVTAVLHTWGQNLTLHPHLHCVVTGGGLRRDGSWVAGRERYFLPVKVLGKLFRGKFLALLQRAYEAGDLELRTDELVDPFAWAGFRDGLYRKSWVVYAKPPFGGPEHVFRYLGRYTHRVAISNHRIVDITDGNVSFVLKDYADSARHKTMTLDGVEFLRRFLLHVLPKGFVRIRHYGLHASQNVNTKLEAARRLLEPDVPERACSETKESSPWWERFREHTGVDMMACPSCNGRLVRCEPVAPLAARPSRHPPRAPPVAA